MLNCTIAYDEKWLSDDVVVLFAASYADPPTSTQAAGVRVLSKKKAEILMSGLPVKESGATIRSWTGTANTLPSGPSSITVLTMEAPNMPPLLSDAADFISAGTWYSS